MQLQCRLLTGQLIFLDGIQCEDTVENVMGKIQLASGVPVDQQRLVFGGKELRTIKQRQQAAADCRTQLQLMLRDVRTKQRQMTRYGTSKQLGELLGCIETRKNIQTRFATTTEQKVWQPQTIADHNIQSGATLHLVMRLRGGMMHRSSGRDDFYAAGDGEDEEADACVLRWQREQTEEKKDGGDETKDKNKRKKKQEAKRRRRKMARIRKARAKEEHTL